jgi:rare lipoprotein A
MFFHPSLRRVTAIFLITVGLALATIAQRADASVMQGIASYYGGKFHGRKTANGEIFDVTRLTAAHRSLPFGTRLKVTNLRNGRSVVVRVNDRGPFIKGRILDLSYAGAVALGFIQSGVAPISLTILPNPELRSLASRKLVAAS